MFRTRALAVAAIATTALALTACGSDSLSSGGGNSSTSGCERAPQASRCRDSGYKAVPAIEPRLQIASSTPAGWRTLML